MSEHKVIALEEEVIALEGGVSYSVRVGENAEWLSKRNGLSVRRAAALADLSRVTVTNWKQGTTGATVENVAALARVLGVPLSYMFLPAEEAQAKVEAEGLWSPFVKRARYHSGPASSIGRQVRKAKRTYAHWRRDLGLHLPNQGPLPSCP